MTFIISPTTPFSSNEQHEIKSWLDGLATDSVDAADRIRFSGATIAVEADDDAAHDVALVAMMAIGRPFYYTVTEERRRLVGPTLAGTESAVTGPIGISA